MEGFKFMPPNELPFYKYEDFDFEK